MPHHVASSLSTCIVCPQSCIESVLFPIPPSAEPGSTPAPGDEDLKSEDTAILRLPEGAEFAAAGADGAAFGDTAEECAAFDTGEGCDALDTTTESAGFVDAAEECAGFADTPVDEEPDLVVRVEGGGDREGTCSRLFNVFVPLIILSVADSFTHFIY